MKRLLVWLVFISVIGVRWYYLPNDELVVGERVRLTVPTVDYPEYSDSATILRRVGWEVRIKDYVEWEPGEVVVVVGEVTRLGNSNIVISENAEIRRGENITWGDKVLIGMSYVRRWAVGRLERILPEPESSLSAGILLGVKRQMPQEFYLSLVKTGTLHIVAASGYNVMVVAGALMAILNRMLGKRAGVVAAVAGIWGYVLLSGASAAVVRAGIMGSLTLIAYYWGRPSEARRLLWITAGLMLLVNPRYMVDVGFQLSVAATAGLIYLSQWLESSWLGRWGWMREYLVPTLAASVATALILWYHFGRVSLISPLVNIFVLPVVPLVMLLSAVTLILPWAGYLAYVPLWWIVGVIRLFG